jgi:uncharacterized protein (TIGR04222 family)
MNPLDLTGPQFLLFYIAAMAAATILAALLRRPAGSGDDIAGRRITVDPYEAAYLRGGPRQAIETAIAMLVQIKALKALKANRALSISGPLPANAHWFEQSLYSKVGPPPGINISAACQSSLMNSSTHRIAENLKKYGLIIPDSRWRPRLAISMLALIATVALGVAKIQVGLSRGRPVGILVFLVIVTAIIALGFFFARPPVTKLGKRALEQLRQENAALEATARTEPQRLATGDVALALGLFGISALAFNDDSWTDLTTALRSSSSSSSGGSSCSSSSCGGGGGCGGGGCGGCGS